ncbi:MAG TPA: branched-chain amino acid ABC transporter permease [Acidimicrobiia bacterium]|nr:branched-chain amino acid ABC transporter permease [Acidimicrobiia bacterium]
MRKMRLSELMGPTLLLIAVAVVGSFLGSGLRFQALSILVTTAIVVSMYVFIGNSGVLSFGHVSFVALGAFSAGLATAPAVVKPTTFPELLPFLANLETGNITSLALSAVLGGVFALLVGIPIMRLSGLSAGIATFAVLIITNNVLRNWEAIGPGAKTLSLIPTTTGFLQATIGSLVVVAVAFAYQRSRWGRMLKAGREDPAAARSVGIDIHRQRLIAFTLSGALAGFSGGLLVHLLGSINTQQVFLDLTFITLAMLVVGGIGSLWGAVVGAVMISGANSVLAEAERGMTVLGTALQVPAGTRLITVGVLMLLVLAIRPDGVSGSREISWRFSRPGEPRLPSQR